VDFGEAAALRPCIWPMRPAPKSPNRSIFLSMIRN
jgi:hypothetical protein